MKRIMDKVARNLTIVGVAAGLLAFGLVSSPSSSLAQEVDISTAEWNSFRAGVDNTKLLNEAGCGKARKQPEVSPVQIGVSYSFTEEKLGFLGWTSNLIVNPSETVAKRDVYAVNLDQISLELWNQVVAQASSSPNGEIRLSVILANGDGYVGTPIKWVSYSPFLGQDLA